MDVRVGVWKKLSTEELMLLNCGVGEDSWVLDCKEIQPVHPKGNQYWMKDWCWSWNSNTFATWCEQLTHWKRPWCWERLKAGREGEDRGWDGWMPSLTRWTWVWVNFGSWWWTGRPGVLQSTGSQRVGHNWATELTDWLTREGWENTQMKHYIKTTVVIGVIKHEFMYTYGTGQSSLILTDWNFQLYISLLVLKLLLTFEL